jgi:hypothetical protein
MKAVFQNSHRFFEASTNAGIGFRSGPPNCSTFASLQTSKLESQAKAEHVWDKHKLAHSILVLELINIFNCYSIKRAQKPSLNKK